MNQSKCFSVVFLLVVALVLQVLVLLGYLPLSLAAPVGVAIVAASGLVREWCPPGWWTRVESIGKGLTGPEASSRLGELRTLIEYFDEVMSRKGKPKP